MNTFQETAPRFIEETKGQLEPRKQEFVTAVTDTVRCDQQYWVL